MEQRSFFGLSEQFERISKTGDPLEVLGSTVDFEYFRSWLVEGAMDRRAAVRRLILSRCSRR